MAWVCPGVSIFETKCKVIMFLFLLLQAHPLPTVPCASNSPIRVAFKSHNLSDLLCPAALHIEHDIYEYIPFLSQ